LPNGVVVYFVSANQLVEHTVAPKKIVRVRPTQIYYFIKEAQVEMKTTTPTGPVN